MERKLAKIEELPAGAENLADGIHLGLPFEQYLADEALGSSDHKKLLWNPCDYWYESNMNPAKPAEKDTPARLRGRAMHKLVLEGERAFAESYMRGPEHEEYMTPAEKAALTKKAKAEAEKLGVDILPAEAYDRIAIASAMITRNPKLATAFTGGIPEVSVFWTRDGVRRKARIDYLKPRGIGDLKSITNQRDLPFPTACRNQIAAYRYDIQGALYIEGRAKITEYVEKGMVYTAPSAHASEVLKKCAETKAFAFQWVFFQAEKAPVTWSRILSPANPIFEVARRDIDTAAANYLDYMERFGRDNIWLLLEDPQELSIDEMPVWWGRI